MQLRLLSPLCLVISVGCGNARPLPEAPSTHLGAASTEARAHESPRSYAIRAVEGRFSAEVEATGAPAIETELDEDGDPRTTVTIPTGDARPIVCLVTNDMRDAGAFVVRAFTSIKNDAQLDDLELPALEVELAQRAPFVWVSSRGVSATKAVDLRAALLPREGGSLFCLQVGGTERATFSRVVGGLVASARHEGWARTRFAEAAVMRTQGKVNGFAQRFVHDGGRETQYGTAFLDQGAGWSAFDWANGATVDARGELTASTSAGAVNGTQLFRIDVKRGKGKEYTFDKEVPGQPPQHGSFKATRPITTDLSRAALVRAFVAGKERERTFLEVHEDPENVEPRAIVIRRVSGRTVSFAYGTKKTVLCEIAPDGMCIRGEITDEDGDKRAWERLYVEGEP